MTPTQYLPLKKMLLALITSALLLALALSSTYAYRAYVVSQMLALPDTGQTESYTDTFGEDADYILNPPTYTDNGETVTDEVTGLIWQKNEVLTATTQSAAESYCDELSLGSYADWRLPSSHELFSLVDLSTSNPPLNTTTFTNTVQADYWWSNTAQADGQANYWAVNAGGGIGPKPEVEAQTHNYYVRCVRDDLSSTSTQDFTDNGDGTVTENNSALMWQQNGPETTMDWEATLTYCESLTLAEHEEWRVPNIKELRSISDDETLFNPSVSTTYFTLTQTSPYWSSTTRENETTQAWYADFDYGLVSHQDKVDSGYTLCVRSENISTNTSIKIYLPFIIKRVIGKS